MTLQKSKGKRVARLAAITATLTVGVLGLTAAPAHAINVNDCSGTGGSWRGSEEGSLSNGVLQAGFCVDTDRKATRTTVQYIKSGGGTVTLRFGWQIISPSDTVKETYWDEGAFTQSAGQTKYYRFEYPTWRPSYDSTYKCGRGIMKDQNSGTQYVTKLVCNM